MPTPKYTAWRCFHNIVKHVEIGDDFIFYKYQFANEKKYISMYMLKCIIFETRISELMSWICKMCIFHCLIIFEAWRVQFSQWKK